jgi:hypothetical protein
MNQIFEAFYYYTKFSLWLKFNVLVDSPKRTYVLVIFGGTFGKKS